MDRSVRAAYPGRAFLAASAGLVLLLLGTSVGAVSEFGRYRALVIGIDDYQNITPLETAVHDASAVHAVLQRKYGFDSELVTNPDRYTLIRKLDALRASLEPDDNLVLYFAGHGILDRETDEGYWLPVDAERDSQANWVPVSTVTRTLRAMAAKHVLVIADSCYSGTLTRDASVRLQTGGDRMEELRRLSGKRARKALTSGGLEPVVDGGRGGHSVFTGTLIDVLRETTEPLDGYTLFTELRRDVIVNADQTPNYGDIRLSGDEGGDFILIPLEAQLALAPESADFSPGSGATRALKPAGMLDVDLAFWESIEDSENPADYQAYLSQYPDGAFAALAASRLEQLPPPGGVVSSAPAAPRVDLVEVEPLAGEYVAMSQANLRTGPSSSASLVRSVAAGGRLVVSGKVPQKHWLRISEDGQVIGYVYSLGLRSAAAVDAAERASAQQARQAQAELEARQQAEREAERKRAEQQAAYQRYLDAQDRKATLQTGKQQGLRGSFNQYLYPSSKTPQPLYGHGGTTMALNSSAAAPAAPVTRKVSDYQPGMVARVSSSRLNVRSGPGTDHGVVYTLHKSDSMLVVGTSGQWIQVKDSQQRSGWTAAWLTYPDSSVSPEVFEAGVAAATPATPAPAVAGTPNVDPQGSMAKLKQVESLLEQNLITEEEAKALRAKILADL